MAPAVWAGVCYLKTRAVNAAFTDCFFLFAVPVFMVAMFFAVGVWEDRRGGSRERVYEPSWRAVCHVLGDDHVHDGQVLRGSWRGRPVRAHADRIPSGRPTTFSGYVLAVPPEVRMPAWEAKLKQPPRPGVEATWQLRADKRTTEERLAEAGLLLALQELGRHPDQVRSGARLFYSPAANEIVFEDGTGEVPSVQVFLAHLELVHRAIAITTNVSGLGSQEGPRPRALPHPYLSIEQPPPWARELLGPAMIGLLVLVAAWPGVPVWLVGALVPAAVVVPLVWRLRIGRR